MGDKMLELNHEMIRTFKLCPKKYWWRYVEGMESIKSSDINLDSLLDKALRLRQNGLTKAECLSSITKIIDDKKAMLPPEEMEAWEILKYIAHGMFSNYPLKPFSTSYIIYGLKLNIAIGEIHYIAGNKQLLEFNDDKEKWGLEAKTTSQTFIQFKERIKVSYETSGIIWSIRQSHPDIKGIIYDYIKKPAMRKGQDENMHQFGERIMADYKARPEIYYDRLYVTRTDEELDLFEDDLRISMYDIECKYRLNNFNRNTDACYHLNTPCPYLSICHTKRPDPMMLNLYFKQSKKEK